MGWLQQRKYSPLLLDTAASARVSEHPDPEDGSPTSRNKRLESKEDYWHGFIPNEDTALILKDDGDFLVRSLVNSDAQSICISIREGDKVYNAIVNRTESGMYEIAGVEYNSIKDMVDELQVGQHVRKRPLQIENTMVVLNRPVPRKGWELKHCMITLKKRLGKGSYGSVYKGILRKDHHVIDVSASMLKTLFAVGSRVGAVQTLIAFSPPQELCNYSVKCMNEREANYVRPQSLLPREFGEILTSNFPLCATA
ncbi:unnamed protein product [Heligmosomoides polygyrus]|uniref:SH2 domain-containing protein n=1 Tax=Heligmosomoides polygyrus TaxID=6339 RepID=A0A183GEJ6_HELPZ|nr:unnamed protein product [Heligmosomoides polygyrus]